MNINILGIRGIPAAHGGFETFAERLAIYLCDKDWEVTVYCQSEGKGEIVESEWKKIKLITIPVRGNGAFSTIKFDLIACIHSLRQPGIFLTLGYNTAIFNLLHTIFGKTNLINMDGIEWKRQKWGVIPSSWFWINEKLAVWFSNHLIADHPQIKEHLRHIVSEKKITMIPYGANKIIHADSDSLKGLNIEPNEFGVVIARPEPENSILEIVQGFSAKHRGKKLVVLGNLDKHNNYHNQIKQAASEEVIFPGAIYDAAKISALRCFASFYIHGHQVGGTNPSLVEALGAGCPIIAHLNKFNEWVAGNSALYFSTPEECSDQISKLIKSETLRRRLSENAHTQHEKLFTWKSVLQQYEDLLKKHYPTK